MDEDNEKIKAVAKQIQDILIENKMAMTPTISIQIIKEKEQPSIIAPESKIILADDKVAVEGDNVLDMVDFMQP